MIHKIALLQISSSDAPEDNIPILRQMVQDAVKAGAKMVFTPEVSNCISLNPEHQRDVLKAQEDDSTLKMFQDEARSAKIWISVGSLALKEGDHLVNRSFMINAKGEIAAQYDKIHMFDIALPSGETYHESRQYKAGDKAVLVDTPLGKMGLSICYDLRFPTLYRALAQNGATILTVPSAFTTTTGKAHWEALLRARAIENSAFVIAAAQTGFHKAKTGRKRETYGHSMVISPWGDILLDGGRNTALHLLEIDLADVDKVRKQIPSLTHDRSFGF